MNRNKILFLTLLTVTGFMSCKNDPKNGKETITVEEISNSEEKENIFGQWTVDKEHSKLAFVVTHHGISEVDGYFKKFEAKVIANKEDLSDAVFEITVATTSIFTDHEERDNELKSESMFNVEKFPLMTFKSTSLEKAEGNKFVMTGNLTIKDITKQINLNVLITGPTAHPNPNNKSQQFGIKAEGVVKRSDFGIGRKLTSAFVSDEVQIRATAGFEKK